VSLGRPHPRVFKPLERLSAHHWADPPFCDPGCEGSCVFRPEPASRPGRVRVRGESLASLLLSNLGDHFYCWPGFSGRRYIFSVFPSSEEASVSTFTDAVILGVARDGAAARPLCFLTAADFESQEGRAARADARANGCCEWHVHFEATEAEIQDIAAWLG